MSFHQPLHDVRLDAHTVVNEVLDRVGDLELAAGGGLDRARRVVDRGGEHVHADERQVGRGLSWLLDQPQHSADRVAGHRIARVCRPSSATP